MIINLRNFLFNTILQIETLKKIIFNSKKKIKKK
jgi:hypothetical protein